jgi:glycogen(starch) synthase
VPTPGERRVRRVLMTADAVGGVWTYAMDLAAALAARGVHVTLAVMGPPMREAQHADAVRRGIDVVQEPFRLEWMQDPWADVERAGPWLMSLADRIGADLVHLNGFCHAALPWRLPTVVVAHSCVRTWWRGVHGDPAPRGWDTYSERVADGLRRATAVVAPTRALLAEVEAEYGVSAAFTVIPNGCSAVERRASGAKEPMVFSAGRLWDEAKNFEAVSAAARQVSWPIYLAGEVEGPTRCFVPSGVVRCLGRLDSEGMREWYGRASIYALPARYEPFGLSIVEAASAGCALVLGDIRTLRENWTGAAVFVPADNRRALATAIESLIKDARRRVELGRLARERASAFTVSRMCDGYLALYEAVTAPAAAA